MYLRHTTRRKDGKTHVYWQLVRSVRRGRKVVQETVAQLGEGTAKGAREPRRWRAAYRVKQVGLRSAIFLRAMSQAPRLRSSSIWFVWSARAASVRCGWAGCCGGR